jgi:signal transduction histidine kinase
MATFTVDTHLFRELGELLVGRDSTALVELIKNAYDADATEVVVYGEALSSLSRGFIQIKDNGTGMSLREFERGFLRIASRTKEQNDRRSPVFSRRYTGAKGIGRLAAHKLARLLEITSARWNNHSPSQGEILRAGSMGLEATIDWNEVEKRATLDEVATSDAITLDEIRLPDRARAGTTVTLKKLRRAWSATEHGRFLEEIQAFAPPKVLTKEIPRRAVSARLLFDEPTVRDVKHSLGSSFSVKLEGDLAPADDFWIAVIDAANWIIEIDADRSSKEVRFAIAPTAQTLKRYPDAEVRRFTTEHPNPQSGPFFQARILKRVGALQGRGEVKQWVGRSSGIRVYMEGFRILPYGEARNDWLLIDRDATERGRGFLDKKLHPDLFSQFLDSERDEETGLLLVPNKHYFGGVFLTERRAPGLKMLVNREGFVPDENYEALVILIRTGIDLCTRVQAAATKETRSERRELRASQRAPEEPTRDTSLTPTAIALENTVREAKQHASMAKRLVAGGKIDAAYKEIALAVTRVERIADASTEVFDENAMVRVLASVGTQLASFIHEINSLLDIAKSVDHAIKEIRSEVGFSPLHKKSLASLHKSVGDLRRTLERQASYLIDVVSPDARRRRSRQDIARRFETGAKLISFAAEKRNIKIINNIPDDLRSPPMFPAELTAVFSNLLSNAIKAVGGKGRIRATGKRSRDGLVVRVENTGKAVRLREAERWFRPFESSTAKVDPVLGQGMGLGLPITRSMLEEYGATIKFAEPSPGFSTAIEMVFPE